MPSNWNKGHTKETHASVLKISQTMKQRKIDNFARWRSEMKRLGKIKSTYPAFEPSGDLAELIGVALGDGHVGVFPRSEVLLIFSHSDNAGFIARYSNLVEVIFKKKPYIKKMPTSNCVRISLYEQQISARLGVPTGARKDKIIKIPNWILSDREYIVRYLRGLYEAEGSLCVHQPTYTYKFLFANRNKSMLANVYRLLKKLGFHPHISLNQVQISRREEVYKAEDLLKFRKY